LTIEFSPTLADRLLGSTDSKWASHLQRSP